MIRKYLLRIQFLTTFLHRYTLGGYIQDDADHTPTNDGQNITFDTEGNDKDGRVNTSHSSSTQPSNHGKPKEKVVINYADVIANQQRLAGSDGYHLDDAASDRSQSNISIGYNHASQSPMRHRSSANENAFESNWAAVDGQEGRHNLF